MVTKKDLKNRRKSRILLSDKKIRNAAIIIIAVILIGIFLDIWLLRGVVKEWFYDKIADPLIGIGTFLVAYLVWNQDKSKRWEDNLPKRITAHIKFKDRYVYTCYNAELAGESDIRAWSQQIGKQMNGNTNLDLYPFYDIESKIVKDEYKLYTVTLYVSKIEFDGYKFWWDNDLKTGTDNQEIICKKEITLPFDDFIEEYKEDNKKPFIDKYNQASTSTTLHESDIKSGKIPTLINKNVAKSKEEGERALLNFSNHPSQDWSESQYQAAKEKYTQIIDYPFPPIPPEDDLVALERLVDYHFERIKKEKEKYPDLTVHLMGEQVFCYLLLCRLRKEQIPAVASTTKREVEEGKTDVKITRFSFVNFRSYYNHK